MIWDYINTKIRTKIRQMFTNTVSGETSVRTSSVLTGSTGNEAEINASGQLSVLLDEPISIEDGGNSITVDAENLDIRNLTSASDSVRIGDGVDLADVIAANGNQGLVTISPGHISTDNSTSTPLTAGSTFTGVWEDIINHGVIVVLVRASHESATDGFVIEYSSDGINVDAYDNITIDAGIGKTFSFQAVGQYFRTRYVNGTSDQTYFRLQTSIKPYYVKPSSHRIADMISGQDDAELVKAILSGETPGGDFINFTATNSGNFKMSLEELENGVSVNSNSQLKTTSFDSSGNEGQSIIGIDYVSGKSGIDSLTETLQTINYEHHEIHNGSHYNFCDYSLNLASGDIIEFVVITPNTTKWIHFTFKVTATSGATIQLYEGTSGVTGGTVITPRNNNRNSLNTSDITLVKDPVTITSDGTRAGGMLAGGTKDAGIVTRDTEFVLKQNTTYLVRITSLAVSNDISWCGEWYEHINKN